MRASHTRSAAPARSVLKSWSKAQEGLPSTRFMWFIVFVSSVQSFVRFSAMRCSITSGSFAGNLAMMYTASTLTYVIRRVCWSIPRTTCFHRKTSASTGSVTGGCGAFATGSPATFGSLLW